MRSEWEAEGREVPPKKEGMAFDSNTITPGTRQHRHCVWRALARIRRVVHSVHAIADM